MLFAVTCQDKPDHEQVRLDNRPDHVAWLSNETVKIHAAGPLLSDDGAHMIGSLLIIDAPDEAALRAELASDPYAKADLFATVSVQRWKWVVGAPEGLGS
ncbi:MAG: YciI family protein [Pseudomonadota bacterium]